MDHHLDLQIIQSFVKIRIERSRMKIKSLWDYWYQWSPSWEKLWMSKHTTAWWCKDDDKETVMTLVKEDCPKKLEISMWRMKGHRWVNSMMLRTPSKSVGQNSGTTATTNQSRKAKQQKPYPLKPVRLRDTTLNSMWSVIIELKILNFLHVCMLCVLCDK